MRLLCFGLLLAACAPSSVPPREAELVSVLARADEVALRTRPQLVTGKFARMAGDPYAFLRGSLPLFRYDWEKGTASKSGFLVGVPPVLGLGDPHPENFGLLIASDGTFALEPNDFDSADLVPFLLDLRRLTTGLGVSARALPVSVEKLGQAAATSYLRTVLERFDGAPIARVTKAQGAIVDDLFRRGARDLAARAELSALTEVTNGVRRFKRGVLDPADPNEALTELPAFALEALPQALVRLGSPRVLDAVRQYGSGVASWPRIRLLLLLEGPSAALGDDVVVELKELTESPFAGWYRPVLAAADTATRVEAASRRSWARPDADPRWFTTEWLGFPMQLRTESEAQKGVNTGRFSGARGTEAELLVLAEVLGALLARVHAQSEPATVEALVRALQKNPEAFVLEEGAFAVESTARSLEDTEHLQHALERLGPTLGITADVRERPASHVEALFGSPP